MSYRSATNKRQARAYRAPPPPHLFSITPPLRTSPTSVVGVDFLPPPPYPTDLRLSIVCGQ